MGYDFLRQLTHPMDATTAGAVFDLLMDHGMEIYVPVENASIEPYEDFALASGVQDVVAGGTIFLASAEREEAVRLLEEAGYAQIISEARKPRSKESELERAERLYYKKRKNTMIAWLVVLVLAFAYYLAKAFLL